MIFAEATVMMIFISISLTADVRNPAVLGQRGGELPAPELLRRSSLPRTKLKDLFPTSSSLGQIYAAQSTATELRSYEDLYSYTVCEGPRNIWDEYKKVHRTFNYFICPDDSNQQFKNHCCMNGKEGEGFCCSEDEKMQGFLFNSSYIVALGLGIFLVVATVIMCGLCVHCRQRRRLNTTRINQRQTPNRKGQVALPGNSVPHGCTTSPTAPLLMEDHEAAMAVPPTSSHPAYRWGNMPPMGAYPPPYEAVVYPQSKTVPPGPVA